MGSARNDRFVVDQEHDAKPRKTREDQRNRSIPASPHPWRTLPAANIKSVDWSQVQQVHWVQGVGGGNNGVVVEFSDGRAVAIKPRCETAVAELAAEHMARAMGVRIPQSRTLGPSHSEREEMVYALLRAPSQKAHMQMISKALTGVALTSDQVLENPFQVCPREFLTISEFIPGYSLAGAEGVFEKLLPEQLENLGRISALDVWINHGEWGPDSVMASGGGVVALDRRVKLLPEGLDRTKRFDEVRIFLDELSSIDDSRPRICEIIASALPPGSTEPTPEQLDHILKGLLGGFSTIARLSKEGSLDTHLEKARKSISGTFRAAAGEVGCSQLDDCLSFVEGAAQTIEETLLHGSSFSTPRGLCGASYSSRPLGDF